MKKVIWVIYLVVLTLMVAVIGYFAIKTYYTPQSHNVAVQNFNLGVVNQEQIVSRALAFQSLNNETELGHKKFHNEIIKEEAKLRSLEEGLKKQEDKASGPSKELYNSRQEFQKKVAQLEQLAQKRKQELQSEYNLNLEIIKRNLEDAVEKIANEKQLVLMVDSKSVMFNNGLDVTDDIIADLNNRISSVKFNLK
jgi:Skp family chaperone for outer membrane proteins